MCKSFCLEKYREEVKISRPGQHWQTSGEFIVRCAFEYCNRKELGLTELLANLVVSKKIKGLLFVHSKVLGIYVEITDTLGPGVFDWALCGKAQNGLVPIKA